MSKLRIAILTSGRFHVCDLARELDALGHQVAFYSCVPPSRTRQFGLPDRCNRSFFWALAPLFLFMRRTQQTALQDGSERLLIQALDRLAARVVRPCDVFIGMSGMSTRAALAARRKFRARIWIERGNRHVLSQKEILERLPSGSGRPKPIPEATVKRELADYALADKIVVPSRHVERSFLERGVTPDRLFRNPYGVDLQMFPPTPAPVGIPPTVITTGAWSLQKGADVLARAWSLLPGVRLTHVGPVQDVPLPQERGFAHFEPVNQWLLKDHYAQAHVFVLASREDGFGMVLSQALSCGLPVVCTNQTGGADLRELLPNPSPITIVPPDDAAALAKALSQVLASALPTRGLRDALGAQARERLSWKAYGRRYHEALAQIHS